MDYCSFNGCWTIIAFAVQCFGHHTSGVTKTVVATDCYDSTMQPALRAHTKLESNENM